MNRRLSSLLALAGLVSLLTLSGVAPASQARQETALTSHQTTTATAAAKKKRYYSLGMRYAKFDDLKVEDCIQLKAEVIKVDREKKTVTIEVDWGDKYPVIRYELKRVDDKESPSKGEDKEKKQ
jgi:hypothetical protein